jgi:hypothetical protein
MKTTTTYYWINPNIPIEENSYTTSLSDCLQDARESGQSYEIYSREIRDTLIITDWDEATQ